MSSRRNGSRKQVTEANEGSLELRREEGKVICVCRGKERGQRKVLACFQEGDGAGSLP